MSELSEIDFVCLLPEGFELTPERWERILAARCEVDHMLSPEEVTALFANDPQDRSS